MSKTALVTGGNKGIGYGICQGLLKNGGYHVILAARDAARGQEAVDKLRKESQAGERIEFQLLDLDNKQSIQQAAKAVADKHKQLDLLVNNAAIAFKGDAFDENIARTTIATNYYGTLNVIEAFAPLVKEGGRVITVSSMASRLSILKNDDHKNFVLSDSLTIEQLSKWLEDFIAAVKDDTYTAKGYPKSAYGMSKIGVTALNRIVARQHPKLTVNCCCPGYVATDMSSYKGHKTVEQGADTPLWLSIDGPTSSGGFYSERALVDWKST